MKLPPFRLSQKKLYTCQNQCDYGNGNRCAGQLLTCLLLHQAAKVIHICAKHLVFFPQLSNQAVMLCVLFCVPGKLLILTSILFHILRNLLILSGVMLLVFGNQFVLLGVMLLALIQASVMLRVLLLSSVKSIVMLGIFLFSCIKPDIVLLTLV